ncbi:MAG TPA: DUF308 domain-containing protein [Sphingobium sp.]|nr:DUF308 domain-containing protein [Sphingobium sp.]
MTSAEPPFPATSRSSTGWRWMLGYGLIVIIIGFVALMNPLATGFVTGLLLAAMLVTYGILAVVSAAASFAERGRWMELALGLLALAAGIFIFFSPYIGALSLVWATGFWLFISGVLQLGGAVRFRVDRFWRVVLGVVDLLLGLLLLFAGPLTGLAFLALMVGISFLFRGVFLITLALSLRRAARET